MTRVIAQGRAGRLVLASAVTSGPWVFVTLRGVPGRAAPHPSWDMAPAEAEAADLLARLKAVLADAGCTPADVVRLDQYYTDWRSVPHYHAARRRAFGGSIPASTSVLQDALLTPGAAVELAAMALRRDGAEVAFMTPDGLEVSPHMGFSPIVRTPELVFFAGQMAEAGNDGIAPEAKVPPTHLWKGSAIRLETDYIIRHKFEPALKAAGIDKGRIAKAQVYLADIADAGAFNAVWRAWFDGAPPATTIVPTSRPGFNCPDASVEINLIAAGAGAPLRHVRTDALPAHDGLPCAVEAGGLLFLSGRMALERDGLAPEARPDPLAPYCASGPEAEAEHVIARADAICAAAGRRLEDAVRIVQFHTDLRDFYPAARAWQRRLGDRPLPLSAVQVPGPLPVPGATMLADIVVGGA